MITINGFMPDKINFPDGTMKLDIPLIMEDSINFTKEANFTWKFESEIEALELMYMSGQITSRWGSDIKTTLYVPYLPNARMDRVYDKKEVFTLKYFCILINSMNFDKVYVLDVHSSVGIALLDRAENINPTEFIKKAMIEADVNENTCFFFPDEGSCKRYSPLVKQVLKTNNIAFGIKERDWETGEIKKITISGANVKDKNIFIIDDICSYGGTVFYSATKLKEMECKDINVFFTHCENSIERGKLFNCGMINKIFTTDSTCTLKENPSLRIYNSNNIHF